MTFSTEAAKMMSDIEEVFGETVTLTKNARGGYATTSGVPTVTQTTQSVRANRLPVRMAYDQIGHGRGASHDTIFSIVIASVTLNDLERGWSITDADGKIYRIVRWEIDAHRLNYILYCKAGV